MENISKLSSQTKSSIIVGGTLLIMGVSWLLTRPSDKDKKSNSKKKRDGKRDKNLKATQNTDSSCYSENYDNYSAEMKPRKVKEGRDNYRKKMKVFLTDNEDLSSVNENFDEFKERVHRKIFNSSSVVLE